MSPVPLAHDEPWAQLERCLTVIHIALLDLACDPASGTEAVAAASAIRAELEGLGGRDDAPPLLDLSGLHPLEALRSAGSLIDRLLDGARAAAGNRVTDAGLSAADALLLARIAHLLGVCERALAPLW